MNHSIPVRRDPLITSRIMSAVRSRDTKPELSLRSELHRRGLRFRKNDPRLLGKPDIVFKGPKVAVFVDGDFFHGHAWKSRGYASFDAQFVGISNADYWRTKIVRNMKRDEQVTRALRREGWIVIRVLASDVLRDVRGAANLIERRVKASP